MGAKGLSNHHPLNFVCTLLNKEMKRIEGWTFVNKVIGVLREPGLYEGADFVNRPVQQGSDLVEVGSLNNEVEQ